MTRAAAIALIVVMTLSLFAGVAVADDDDNRELTRIDDGHELAHDWAIDEWQDGGYVEGDVDTYDMQITVAEGRADVADEGRITDFSDWVRIEYNEEISRTLRIHLPRDYGQPYERVAVESITSDHEVDLKPARDGEMQSLVVEVDGPAEIVVPLEWDGQLSYGILERAGDRYERLAEYNPLSGQAEWEYVDAEDFDPAASVVIGETSDEHLIEVDARPDQADPRWIPVPTSDADEPVYRDERDGEVIVIATVDDPPDVRFAEDYGAMDRIRSEINSAREIPDRIMDWLTVPDWIPLAGESL